MALEIERVVTYVERFINYPDTRGLCECQGARSFTHIIPQPGNKILYFVNGVSVADIVIAK